MNWIDVIAVLWFALSIYSGFRMGFVYKAGTFVGFIAGIVIAAALAPGIAASFGWHLLGTVLTFLILSSLISKLFGIVAWLLNLIFKLVSIIPFLKTANRLLGAVLSIVITIFFVSLSATVADALSNGGGLSQLIDQSVIVSALIPLSFFYLPLFPDSFQTVLYG